jgi:hypothetical protein
MNSGLQVLPSGLDILMIFPYVRLGYNATIGIRKRMLQPYWDASLYFLVFDSHASTARGIKLQVKLVAISVGARYHR